MPVASTAYVGIGANLGDPVRAVTQAITDLDALPGTKLVAQSSLYRSAPVDAQGDDYINAVAGLSTSLTPHQLLAALQAIENAAGRQRPFRNAPRTLDLDLLLFDAVRMDTVALTLPHPRMAQRAFVLVPLHEIAPQRVSAQELQAVAGQRLERL